MTQPIANEQLSAYLDGELTDVERGELEKALAEDPALRQELARLEGAVAFLRTHGPIQAPRGFHEKVLAKVEAEPMPGWWWRWLRRPFGIPVEGFAVALAAAMVLLVALPFGLQTATKGGKDLASDPYGWVSGEDARSSLGAKNDGSEPKEGAARQLDEQEEEPAVAALEPDEDANAVEGLMGARTAAKPLPPPSATPMVATGEGAGTEDKALPTASTPTGGYGDVQAPAAPGALLAYQILTYDEDALAKLQRIAARYRGRVLDSSGSTAKALTLEPGRTYMVEVPASALAAFGDDLRGLGMVTEQADPRRWAGDTVRVQITFQVMPSDESRAIKAAPSTSSEAQ